jgi:phospholipid-binding lipoprotein MlaA
LIGRSGIDRGASRPAFRQTGSPRSLGTLQPFNFKFNDALDRAIAKPVAKGYVEGDALSRPHRHQQCVQQSRHRATIINDVAAGQDPPGRHDSRRFLMNSTLGLGGLFDPRAPPGSTQ